jgi:uncharacterized integral membrane protein
MKSLVRIVLASALALYTAWIVATNGESVTVRLGFATLEGIPLWMPLVLALVIGSLVTGLLLSIPLLRLRLRLRRESRRVGELEQEVHGLRKLPLGEDTADRGQAHGA